MLAQIFVRHRIYQRRIADMSSQLGSVAGANSRKNIGYVALDGLSGEEQPGCDLWIAVAGGNKYRDLPFAVAQLIQRGIAARRTTTPPRMDAEPAQPGFRQPLLGFRTSRARFHPRLAPYKVAVLPLSKKDTLTPTAREVLAMVQPHFMTDYDETQAIGRRYRRQDEIGTPYCVTIDFETLEDRAVTVRDRDTLAQDRVSLDKLVDYLKERLP